MAGLRPLSRSQLIARLKEFGFQGPFTGGRHAYMIKGDIRLTIPNPHRHDMGADLLTRLLKQAGIEKEAWLRKD